jgi:hypothetical protein
MTLLMVLHHPFSYLILNFSKNMFFFVCFCFCFMFLFLFHVFLFFSGNSEVSKVWQKIVSPVIWIRVFLFHFSIMKRMLCNVWLCQM